MITAYQRSMLRNSKRQKERSHAVQQHVSLRLNYIKTAFTLIFILNFPKQTIFVHILF